MKLNMCPSTDPPEITLTSRKVGQRKGHDAVMECMVSASPLDGMFWERRYRINSSGKYTVEVCIPQKAKPCRPSLLEPASLAQNNLTVMLFVSHVINMKRYTDNT